MFSSIIVVVVILPPSRREKKTQTELVNIENRDRRKKIIAHSFQNVYIYHNADEVERSVEVVAT